MAFGIALSGLAASQTDLDVTANNIANAETTGFKGSRTDFSELFSSSLQGVSSTQSGNGVRVSSIAQQFSQGNIQNSNNSLDMAVNGSGFFVVTDSGTRQYTRSGSFSKDASGFVVNASGQRLQVYPYLGNNQFNTSTLSDLQLITNQSAPAATTSAQTVFNLPASAPQPANATFSPTDPSSYNNATSVTVYDSLGAAHTASIYFIKTATTNQWNTRMYLDGTAVGGAQAITYSSAGALTAPVGGQLNFGTYTPTTGAAALNISFDFSKSTQYGNKFSVTNIAQDGYTTGQLTGVSVSGTGVVQANFTNGQSVSLGQVALINFSNPQGLQKLDGTNWAESFSSGQPITGVAGSAGFGQLQSGAIEASNVDVTKELVNMIVAQRNYSANAQMISAEKSITETIINMSR